jgi:hypothetical protein
VSELVMITLHLSAFKHSRQHKVVCKGGLFD